MQPRECPTECVIIPLRWGKYLGAEALEQGVDVMVSSWTRIAPNTLPALAKSAANYANSGNTAGERFCLRRPSRSRVRKSNL